MDFAKLTNAVKSRKLIKAKIYLFSLIESQNLTIEFSACFDCTESLMEVKGQRLKQKRDLPFVVLVMSVFTCDE